jgi:hypothetical protein
LQFNLLNAIGGNGFCQAVAAIVGGEFGYLRYLHPELRRRSKGRCTAIVPPIR